MDLGTIKKNIVDRKYKTLVEANDDVRLVWQNCMTYNADGSDFFILAQGLNKKWMEKWRKLLEDFNVEVSAASSALPAAAGANNNKLSLDEKRSFAKSLYKISKEDLGRVLVEIEKKHPAALVRNSAEDEVELNVDKLPSSLFAELQQFIKGATAGSKPKKKSSSGGGGGKRQKS